MPNLNADAGEFIANGVHINKPYNDPNGKIYAILKSEGTIVALDRAKDFNPKFHARYNPNTIAVQPEVPVLPTLTGNIEAAPQAPSHNELRFKQLAEKGWVNLNKVEKAEYQFIKAQNEPNEV